MLYGGSCETDRNPLNDRVAIVTVESHDRESKTAMSDLDASKMSPLLDVTACEHLSDGTI